MEIRFIVISNRYFHSVIILEKGHADDERVSNYAYTHAEAKIKLTPPGDVGTIWPKEPGYYQGRLSVDDERGFELHEVRILLPWANAMQDCDQPERDYLVTTQNEDGDEWLQFANWRACWVLADPLDCALAYVPYPIEQWSGHRDAEFEERESLTLRSLK